MQSATNATPTTKTPFLHHNKNLELVDIDFGTISREELIELFKHEVLKNERLHKFVNHCGKKRDERIKNIQNQMNSLLYGSDS
jgi:hypothetical protein